MPTASSPSRRSPPRHSLNSSRPRGRLVRITPRSAYCRYALRPPIAQDRLHLTPDGQVVLALRHRWSDGTTHLVFDPIELLEHLAALSLRQAQAHPERSRGVSPRPRINLVLYYGVFAPHARHRARVVAAARCEPGVATTAAPARGGGGAPGACSGPAHRAPGQPCGPPGLRPPAADSVAPAAPPRRQTPSDWGGASWAQLMRRSFPPSPRLRRGTP